MSAMISLSQMMLYKTRTTRSMEAMIRISFRLGSEIAMDTPPAIVLLQHMYQTLQNVPV
jgi:hypothetical protein